ncbi:hypothetical protein PSHT_12514 [Puccinia striiformis]|nr:hypothetical protein PSHT_12514 [Puccinia striiformis]
MFVEENRRNGKNCVADFTNPYVQTDDDRMDALAITPVCLRVAFTLDNKLGYIPISLDNPNYLLERKHEDDDGLDECHCSNCNVEKFRAGLSKIIHMKNDNLDALVSNPQDINNNPLNITLGNPATIAKWHPGPTDTPLEPVLESFAKSLLSDFKVLFAESFDLSASDFLPAGLFNIENA